MTSWENEPDLFEPLVQDHLTAMETFTSLPYS